MRSLDRGRSRSIASINRSLELATATATTPRNGAPNGSAWIAIIPPRTIFRALHRTKLSRSAQRNPLFFTTFLSRTKGEHCSDRKNGLSGIRGWPRHRSVAANRSAANRRGPGLAGPIPARGTRGLGRKTVSSAPNSCERAITLRAQALIEVTRTVTGDPCHLRSSKNCIGSLATRTNDRSSKRAAQRSAVCLRTTVLASP